MVGPPRVLQIAREEDQIHTPGGLSVSVGRTVRLGHQFHRGRAFPQALQGEGFLVEAHRGNGLRMPGLGFQIARGVAGRVRQADGFLQAHGTLGHADDERRPGPRDMLVAHPQSIIALFGQHHGAAGLAGFPGGQLRDPFPGKGMVRAGIHQQVTLAHADRPEALRQFHPLGFQHHPGGLAIGGRLFRQSELSVNL